MKIVKYMPYKKVGYDVIVFVPSIKEDNNKIIYGNAILAFGENN